MIFLHTFTGFRYSFKVSSCKNLWRFTLLFATTQNCSIGLSSGKWEDQYLYSVTGSMTGLECLSGGLFIRNGVRELIVSIAPRQQQDPWAQLCSYQSCPCLFYKEIAYLCL